MKSLNLGVLAHVDAGKTSLTERLLFNAGVIKTLGSVDGGTTHTDSLALERKRGITIKSAVTSFTIGDLKVNLIDTPGHPDFIAEVERSLGALDAVVLVISAVEGVQPQTRVLMRILIKMKIPTLIFINKIDRMGARDSQLVRDIQQKLFPNIVTMNSVIGIGTKQAKVKPIDMESQQELESQVRNMKLCPIFFGSAMTGVGVEEMTGALERYLAPDGVLGLDELSAVVFKIERNTRGEKVAYTRIFGGILRTRMQVQLSRNDRSTNGKISKIERFENGTCAVVMSAHGGDIVKLQGLSDCRIGDTIGRASRRYQSTSFASPHLEVVVAATDSGDKSKLHTALMQLGEQDPLIQVRQSELDGTLSVQLYGEVQKEVIRDTLANDYGVNVTFEPTTTICIERLVGVGEAIEIKAKTSKSYLEWDGHTNPFLATIGLRVEPTREGTGVHVRFAKEIVGRMPSAFYTAVKETIPQVLRQGLYGWQVADCIVTLIEAEYYPRQSTAHGVFDKNISSTARDFRSLTPLVLMNALKQAKTAVYEPVNRFEFDIPSSALSKAVQRLGEVEARLEGTTSSGEMMYLTGKLPARRTFEFEQSIPDITNGEGVFTSETDGYWPVIGKYPSRPRTDNNPLCREDYFRQTLDKSLS